MSKGWRPEGYEDQDIASGCSVGLFFLIFGGGMVLLLVAKVMAVMGW